MATGRIDSFYNLPELAKEQAAVQAMLLRTLEMMKQVQDGVKATGGKIPGNGGGAQAKKDTDALTRANDALKQSLQATNLELQRVRTQTAMNNTEARQQAKALGLVGGAYDKLSGSLELARKQYRDLAAEEKHLSDTGVNLAKNIAAMDAKIKAIDASMGNHQRNVGNYAGSFNALGNSVNQLTRELPAFTFSAQTGFLAISNNIPILTDAIKGVRAQNKLLASEGKPTVSVLKQLAGAVFSWGTALSIGVTLLTVYGKEIAAFVFGTEEATEASKKLKEAQESAIQAIGDEAAKVDILVKTLNSETTSRNEKKAAIKELQRIQPDYFGSLKLEDGLVSNLDKSYQAYAASILTAAKSAAVFERVKDLSNKKLVLELDLNKEALDTANKKAAEVTKMAEKAFKNGGVMPVINLSAEEKKAQAIGNQIGAIDIQIRELMNSVDLASLIKGDFKDTKGDKNKIESAKSFTAEYLKVLSDQQRLQLQAEANVQDRIQANEKDTLDARLTALKKYMTAKTALIGSDRGAELQDLANQRAAIVKDYDDKIAQAAANKEDTTQLAAAKAKELVSFDKYATEQSKFIYEKYYQELLDLERDTSEKSKAIYASKPGSGTGILPEPDATKEQANELLKIVSDNLVAQDKLYQEFAKKRTELLEALHNKEIDLAGQALSTVGEFADGMFDRKKNAIQEEIDLITERSNKEIEAVNNSARNEQEKADAIAIIRTSAQAQKEQLELRQRRIDEQKAKFERMFQIFEIGIQTIKSVAAIKAQAAVLSSNPATASLAALAYAQIPITLASGALSIAAILAKPIPKFAVGTKHSPEGPAWVGEEGIEGRINPDKSFELTPGRPTLTYLKKGTEIISNPDLMEMLPQIAMSQQSQRPMTEDAYAAMMIQKLTNELSGKLDRVEDAIKNKKETHFSFGPEGFRAAVKQGATWTEYLNRGWKD